VLFTVAELLVIPAAVTATEQLKSSPFIWESHAMLGIPMRKSHPQSFEAVQILKCEILLITSHSQTCDIISVCGLETNCG